MPPNLQIANNAIVVSPQHTLQLCQSTPSDLQDTDMVNALVSAQHTMQTPPEPPDDGLTDAMVVFSTN